jgi:hypothetical protein
MLEEGAFSAPAPPHNDEDVASVNGEGKIPLEDEIPISHRQVFNDNVGFSIPVHHHYPPGNATAATFWLD